MKTFADGKERLLDKIQIKKGTPFQRIYLFTMFNVNVR